jgi:hypothetical protein
MFGMVSICFNVRMLECQRLNVRSHTVYCVLGSIEWASLTVVAKLSRQLCPNVTTFNSDEISTTLDFKTRT